MNKLLVRFVFENGREMTQLVNKDDLGNLLDVFRPVDYTILLDNCREGELGLLLPSTKGVPINLGNIFSPKIYHTAPFKYNPVLSLLLSYVFFYEFITGKYLSKKKVRNYI